MYAPAGPAQAIKVQGRRQETGSTAPRRAVEARPLFVSTALSLPQCHPAVGIERSGQRPLFDADDVLEVHLIEGIQDLP
jgi:hypothetical protein